LRQSEKKGKARFMTDFSTLISDMAREGDEWTSNPTEDWRQGRTLFGGLSAALCFAACEAMAPDLPPLRSAQIAYVGPSAGQATLRPSILRRGKSVTFMACDLIADGAIATRALFCFGAERESAYSRAAAGAPAVPRPQECDPLFKGQAPTFAQHLDQRVAGGHRPVSGAPDGDLLVWVKHRDQNPPQSLVSLVALGDALPPASLPRLHAPAAISTMTWQFDLIDPARFDASRYVLIRSTDDALGHGYSGQVMAMWDEEGHAILTARQSVAVFA
jgi:acyl-CoA thioesterase